MKNKHNIKYFPKKEKGYSCNLKFVIVDKFLQFHIFNWRQNSTYIISEKQNKKNTAKFETESSHF